MGDITLRNGIYSVVFDTGARDDTVEQALIAVRDGEIFGSDRNGGVFRGLTSHRADGVTDTSVTMTVPPFGELITGFRAGSLGAAVAISGTIDGLMVTQSTVVDVGGIPVSVAVDYLGPLPE